MASDPITGLSTDDVQAQSALDYLGRSSPIAFAQQSALPSVGSAPSTGPASPGGAGSPMGGGTSVGASFGQNTFGPSAPGLATQLGAGAAGTILGLAKGQLKDLIPNATGAGAGGVLGSGGAGVGDLLATGGEFVGMVPKEELFAGGAGALTGESGSALGAGLEGLGGSAAELGAGSLLGAYGGMSAAYDLMKLAMKLGAGINEGPTTGNMWGDMGLSLLGGPVGDAAKALVGRLLEPSSAWQSFGEKVGQTLQGTSSAINTLVPWLGKAQTRGDISQYLDLFRQLVETGAGVGGYQLGKGTPGGAPQVGLLPGAFGSKHEGGITADFGPVTTALNDYISKLYDVLPEGGPGTQLSYQNFATGMDPATYDKFMLIANDAISFPDQAQQMIANSGLPPDRQEQLLRYVTSGQAQTQQAQAEEYQKQQAGDFSQSYGPYYGSQE